MKTTDTNEPIFEINKSAFLDTSETLVGLDQTKEKKRISVNIEFCNYDDLGFNIECLLHAVTSVNDEEIIKQPVMFQNIVELSSQLLKALPLEFLDELLIRAPYRENEFTNIKNL